MHLVPGVYTVMLSNYHLFQNRLTMSTLTKHHWSSLQNLKVWNHFIICKSENYIQQKMQLSAHQIN